MLGLCSDQIYCVEATAHQAEYLDLAVLDDKVGWLSERVEVSLVLAVYCLCVVVSLFQRKEVQGCIAIGTAGEGEPRFAEACECCVLLGAASPKLGESLSGVHIDYSDSNTTFGN